MGAIDPIPNRHADSAGTPPPGVYVLELAGEDDRFAAAEAGAGATGIEVIGPGLATARSIVPGRIRGLAYCHRASELLGRTDASVSSARALLSASTTDRSGTVAVRARDVRSTARVDARRVERELGDVLVERGFSVDLANPDHELRALFADDVCALGWLAAESIRDYGDRAPTDRPFFQPGAMDPLDARAVANLVGARSGVTVLDPMCGTGGLLIEAGLLGARVIGSDAQRKMVRGARRNLVEHVDGYDVMRADATRLPIGEDAVDAVLFDAPYGRQSRIEGDDGESLVRGALAEARRVASRAVVVSDRSLEAVAREAGWDVDASYDRRVHRSLTRYVHVLE